VALEQLLVVELRDVVRHGGDTPRLRPADTRGALAARVESIPQGFDGDPDLGAITEMLDGRAGRSVEDHVP
jgi:hypothetical protein